MVHTPIKGRNILFGGRHCERTMFFFFGSLFFFVFFGALLVADNFDLSLGTFQTNQGFEFTIGPTEIVIGFGIFTIAGYLGVIYYRYEHEPRKNPVFIWKFWKAER